MVIPLLSAGLLLAAFAGPQDGADAPAPDGGVTPEAIIAAGRLIGLQFTQAEAELMRRGVEEHRQGYATLQAHALDNSAQPALRFDPLVAGVRAEPWMPPAWEREWPDVERPDDLESLAFADIPTLASLVRARKVSCVELTELSLRRLERMDATLHCVISLTAERARAQARRLDEELAEGRWRGMLHGIPWGAKDLLAARGTRTTWGARPFAEQVIDLDATVVRRLDEAGAVLVAKLSLGALAWGDVWYGETTRNPWNPEQGSSGSSAGPAAATAAGGVAFAIGSETYGSIVSPSERCGTSALRPTFGRVSRHGAMTLSWSMDKLGPMCRSVADAALVFDAIVGPDGHDLTVREMPWRVPGPTDVSGWRVGVPEAAFEASEVHVPVLATLLELGVDLVPVQLPDLPVEPLLTILSAEAATAFDALTRDGTDDELVRQVDQAWPNVFRVARLVPAVEYLRADRLRAVLCRQFDAALGDLVAVVHPSFADDLLAIGNLTGHPAVVAPAGFREDGTPFGVTFTGRLYDEARLLALAAAWQGRGDHHRRHPPTGGR